jgi:maltodextrin utilization protein YvdJ
MLLVILFLNGLMTIPVTLNYANMTEFPVSDYYPNAMALVDDQVATAMTQVTFENGEMLFSQAQPLVSESPEGTVAFGIENDQVNTLTDEGQTALIFQENQFILAEDGAPTATVLYTRDFDLSGLDQAGIQEALSQQWLDQNRILVVLIFSTVISIIFLAMNLFLVAIAALMFYMTKGSPVTSIETYKESINLILNALSVPTFLAMVYGLYNFDVSLMASLQMIGLVTMLLLVMWKTRFRDGTLDEYQLLEA